MFNEFLVKNIINVYIDSDYFIFGSNIIIASCIWWFIKDCLN